MKRILFLILGYYLAIQAGFGVLTLLFANPQNGPLIMLIAVLSGMGGYKLILMGRSKKAIENAPTKELPVPETQPLERK